MTLKSHENFILKTLWCHCRCCHQWHRLYNPYWQTLSSGPASCLGKTDRKLAERVHHVLFKVQVDLHSPAIAKVWTIPGHETIFFLFLLHQKKKKKQTSRYSSWEAGTQRLRTQKTLRDITHDAVGLVFFLASGSPSTDLSDWSSTAASSFSPDVSLRTSSLLPVRVEGHNIV